MPQPIGAHSVPAYHLYAVARVSGLIAHLWATATGIWIVFGGATKALFSPTWQPLVTFVHGRVAIVGWIILGGGLLGLIGLASRIRPVSLTACIICAAWCGWVSAFGWWSNYHGNANFGSWFSMLATGVFILRFWLLTVTPAPGERHVSGW